VIFTRIAVVVGAALFVFLVVLALNGLSFLTPILVSGFALLILVGIGNMTSGRSGRTRQPRHPAHDSPAPPEDRGSQ
jgi:hypothetical protein